MSNYPSPPPTRRGWGPVLMAIVVGAGLAVLTIVGWTVFLLTRGGDSPSDEPRAAPSTPSTSYPMAGKVAWQDPSTASEKDRAVRQAWSTPDLVVYLDRVSGQVRGLDKTTGTERWSFQVEATNPDDDLDRVCAASRNAADGAVAISFERRKDSPVSGCTSLMMLDLATGRPRWSKQKLELGSDVEAGAGVVIYSWGDLVAFDAATGKPRWSTDPTKLPGACGSTGTVNGFRLVAAGTRSVVAQLDCESGQEVWTLDARTGRPAARAWVGRKDLAILGTDPVTVLVDESTVRVLSADGRTVARSFTITGRFTNLPGSAPSVWLWKSYLITSESAMSDTIDAWDLRTGRQAWATRLKRATSPDDPTGITGTQPVVVGIDDKGVICVLATSGELAAVARLDLATGKQTDLSPVFRQAAFTPPDQLWWFWDGKRVVGVHNEDPSPMRDDEAIAFAVE